MECTEWEVRGLLYTSNELDARQRDEYEIHLTNCVACQNELKDYLFEKKNYFLVQILGETPSEAFDAKIKMACSMPVKPTSAFSILFSVVKVAGVPVFLLLFGLIIGLYFKNNVENARNRSVTSQYTERRELLHQYTPDEKTQYVFSDSFVDSLKSLENVSRIKNMPQAEVFERILPVDMPKK